MAKILAYDDEARQKLASGVTKLARAVRCTLGPRGRNAVLDKGWGSPTVTKDGVTVAEEIELNDPYENMGAQLVKEAARKTTDVPATAPRPPPSWPRRSTAKGSRPSPPAPTRWRSSAASTRPSRPSSSTSSGQSQEGRGQEGDHRGRHDRRQQRPSIGEKLADAFEKVGTDGVITVEEGKQAETDVDVVEGMQFDRGYLSPHFVTDQERMEVVLEDAYILIYEEKISTPTKPDPAARERSARPTSRCLIIAEDIEGEALATLVVNKLRGHPQGLRPSRPPATAIAARPCWATSPS